MFVVALVPLKSHCYVLFIYHVKNIGQVSPSDLYFETVILCMNSSVADELLLLLVFISLIRQFTEVTEWQYTAKYLLKIWNSCRRNYGAADLAT